MHFFARRSKSSPHPALRLLLERELEGGRRRSSRRARGVARAGGSSKPEARLRRELIDDQSEAGSVEDHLGAMTAGRPDGGSRHGLMRLTNASLHPSLLTIPVVANRRLIDTPS